MRVGLHIGKFDWSEDTTNLSRTLEEIAKTADKSGFYSIWVMDHLFQLGTQFGIIHGPVEGPMLEGYTTMSYLAAVTKKIKLGLLVTCAFYRHPGVLVKIVSSLDVLSRGRTYFGLGAGWFERECRGLGIPFPSMRERYERLEETLRISKQMWQGDTTPFNGKYYTLEEPINCPQPISKPHPPILIGGGGEKKTLRLVAEYSDACNFVFGPPLEDAGVIRREWDETLFAALKRKLSVLKQHCKDVGRPYDEIEKTVVTYVKFSPDVMRPEQVIDLCKRLDQVGFQHIIFNIPNVHEIRPLEIMGEEIIPIVSEFGTM